MFKKRWKIFKWSLPAWVVILALLTVSAVAVGAFLNTFYPSVDITAMDAPVGTWSDFTCDMSNPPGTIDTCLDNGDGTATVAVSNVDDESELHISARYTTTEWHQVWWALPSPLPAGVDEITHFPASDGTAVNDSNALFHHYVSLADLSPSQVISGMTVGWEAEVYIP